MTDKLHDEVFEGVLAYMAAKYPELVGSGPGWPRFDRFKTAYGMMKTESILLEQAISDTSLLATIHKIAETIYALNIMAIVMGVDMRPVMAAVHRFHMADDAGEVDLQLILELQDPLPQPMLAPVE